MGATSAKADWFSVDFMSIIQSLEQSGCGDCSESQSASISQQ
jgi:ArsR family metal-binding transcriptional regulator